MLLPMRGMATPAAGETVVTSKPAGANATTTDRASVRPTGAMSTVRPYSGATPAAAVRGRGVGNSRGGGNAD